MKTTSSRLSRPGRWALGIAFSASATFLCASGAHATMLFQGSEFLINTYTTSFQQGKQARAVSERGDCSFVVAWESGVDPQDGSWWGVFGQRFNHSAVPQGTEFQANTFTYETQYQPAIAAFDHGGFVVVWESYDSAYGNMHQDGFYHGIFGQRYDAAGNPDGTEFPVNTVTSGYEQEASVAADTSGKFVVVWRSKDDYYGVRAMKGQRFDALGNPDGTEFQVDSCSPTCFTYNAVPDVTYLKNGRFVVVWQSYRFNNTGYNVYGQRFDSLGFPDGTEFRVNSYTGFDQIRPAVSAAPNGDFVVVWDGYHSNDYSYGISGQRFDNGGIPLGTQFDVNQFTIGYQQRADVAVDDDGSFVVVWENDDAYGYGDFATFGRRYDNTGAPDGNEFQINTYNTGYQIIPSIDTDGKGNFVVVWRSGEYGPVAQDGELFGMYGQRLCVDVDGDAACDSPCTVNDHRLCYYYKKVIPTTAVTLSDIFDTGTYLIRTARWTCPPADKNNEGIITPDIWENVYRANGPHVPRQNVGVTNQFGTFQFDTVKTVRLMVPSNVTFFGQPPPSGPPGPTVDVDHYRCIRVKYSAGSPTIPNNFTISVVDGIGQRTLSKLQPRELCVATNKNDEGIFYPDAHLTCYTFKTTLGPQNALAHVHDQFGPTTYKYHNEQRFCVPSRIVP